MTWSETQESVQDKELDQRKAITRKRSLGEAADCRFVKGLSPTALGMCCLGGRAWALMGKRVRVVCIS